MSQFFKKLFSETVPTEELLQGALDEEILDEGFLKTDSLRYLFSRFENKKQLLIHNELRTLKHFNNTVEFLIKNGANPTISLNEGGLSPLQLATVNNIWPLVEIMLSAPEATQEYFEEKLPQSHKNSLDFLSKNPSVQKVLHLKKSSNANNMDFSKINSAPFFVDLVKDNHFSFIRNEDGVVTNQITLNHMVWPTNHKTVINSEIYNLDSLALLYIAGIKYHNTERRMIQKNISSESIETLKNNLEQIKFQTHYSKEPLSLFELYVLRLLNKEENSHSNHFTTLDSFFFKKMKLSDDFLKKQIAPDVNYKALLFMGIIAKTNLTIKEVSKIIKWPYSLDSSEGLSDLKKASKWLLENKKIKNKKWLVESLEGFWSQYLWTHHAEKLNQSHKPTFKVLNILSDLSNLGMSIESTFSYFLKEKDDDSYKIIQKNISNSGFSSFGEKEVRLNESFWLSFIFSLQANSGPVYPKSEKDSIVESHTLPDFIKPWVQKKVDALKNSPSLKTFWIEHLVQQSLKGKIVKEPLQKIRF